MAQKERPIAALTLLVWGAFAANAFAADVPQKALKPLFVPKPDAFQTLVNPECSHCVDEAKRRASELRNDDRVLSWIRGYSDGGAIPYRFFLNPYRVISDSYGVFVYDPDAGFARGFEPSYDFRFHGWRNGVMVMSHKDGTLYSCLSGIAFDGPRKGDRLKPIPTLVTNWGAYLKAYPGGVAYKMFDKYQPVELPTKPNDDARRSRLAADPRLEEQTWVLGVVQGSSSRVYPVKVLAKSGLVQEEIDGEPRVILWNQATQTAVAYKPIAVAPNNADSPPKKVSLEKDPESPRAPFIDKETKSHWDIAGRAVDGELKGWTLEWLEGTQVRWFAWSAEYPETTIYGDGLPVSKYKSIRTDGVELPPPHGNLDASLRRSGVVQSVDLNHESIVLVFDGDNVAEEWPLRKGAEIWCSGWWGRLDQFRPGERAWVWFDADKGKSSLAISFLADELSQQSLYGPYKVDSIQNSSADKKTLVLAGSRGGKSAMRSIDVAQGAAVNVGDDVYVETASEGAASFVHRATFSKRQAEQKKLMRLYWQDQGLPGTLVFIHEDRNEAELMLDHEVLAWARQLQSGNPVVVQAGDTQPASGTVQRIRPWHERTQVLVKLNDHEMSDFAVGRRMFLKLDPQLIARISHSDVLPGEGRMTDRLQRIEWLASGIYCTCGMHDECAGHVFTLASCDAVTDKPCGLAKRTRELLGEQIDKGLSDKQILDELVKQRGDRLLRPHMSP